MKLKLSPGGTVLEIAKGQDPKLAIAKHLQLNPNRLKILNETLADGMTVKWKDLGPQISWQTVFIVEYAGPILIHLAMAWHARHLNAFQGACLALIVIHFVKREWETLFVHRFSHATMPLSNLFKNCGHYWLLSGVAIGWQLYSPDYHPPAKLVRIVGLLAFVLGEWGNWHCHQILAGLRRPGSRDRGIPHGHAFTWFSCANYTMEILAWIGFSMLTGLSSAWIFTLVASVQMGLWAKKKHDRYLQVSEINLTFIW